MESVIIKPRNKKELEFVADLLSKLGIASKTLSIEEQEDLGLSILMKNVDRSRKGDKNTILKKLQA
jgi:hypothetical protein